MCIGVVILENVSNVMTQYDGIIAYFPEIIQYNGGVVAIFRHLHSLEIRLITGNLCLLFLYYLEVIL